MGDGLGSAVAEHRGGPPPRADGSRRDAAQPGRAAPSLHEYAGEPGLGTPHGLGLSPPRSGLRMVKALLLVFAASTAFAQQRPSAAVSGDRVLVSLPESVLKDGRVKSRLESALTTTFILKTSLGAAARMEIRYDLW